MNLLNLTKKFASEYFIQKLPKPVYMFFYSTFYSNNLIKLCTVYHSDKWGKHWYAQHYQKYFASLNKKRLNILEIGIGGYKDPNKGGASLRVWRTYFPKSTIYGIDIHDKKVHEEKRIKTFKGSQVDLSFLKQVLDEVGCIDIIIDDGSHINEHVITSFKYLFPLLSKNGIYVIEDAQTSYWKKYGGSSSDLNSTQTIMGFFKNLADGLNYQEFSLQDYTPCYFEKHIVSIHFYHNLIFIFKGDNNEKSNVKEEKLTELITAK